MNKYIKDGRNKYFFSRLGIYRVAISPVCLNHGLRATRELRNLTFTETSIHSHDLQDLFYSGVIDSIGILIE